MCFFGQIITDIGDNQSIEKSFKYLPYRLKNMKYFLRKCNQKTLSWIDEFGTGSNLELECALAEAFFRGVLHRELWRYHYHPLLQPKSIGQRIVAHDQCQHAIRQPHPRTRF